MEEIQTILNSPINQNGAQRLLEFYQTQTGQKLKTGCFCKTSNIQRVYDQVRNYVNSL